MLDSLAELDERPVGLRLQRAGISYEQGVMLRELDPRIVEDAPTATPAAVERLAWWCRAGLPPADVKRLLFSGSDDVRQLVEEAHGLVPAPIAWFGIEYVQWLEVGRRGEGWCGVAWPGRVPAGDRPQRILLSGAASDAVLGDIIVHELAHAWHRSLSTGGLEPPAVTEPLAVRNARLLAAARDLGIDEPRGRLATILADEEYLAEATCSAWGFQRLPLHREAMRRRQGFLAELNDIPESP